MTGLVAVAGRYPHTRALFAGGPVTLADGEPIGFTTPDRVGGAVGFISRMLSAVPGLDFDVCELPLVNYFAAKERGAAFTAIPVVLTRRFPHPMLLGNLRRGVETPADLAGQRVGISYYGNTDATWVRGLLADFYGVDLDSITWVTAFEEQVVGAAVPPNTIHLPRVDLDQMLDSGDIAGQVVPNGKLPAAAHLVRLIADPESEQRAWYQRTGVFPPLHTVVVKDQVLRDHPAIAHDLFELFTGAKQLGLAELAVGTGPSEAAAAQARMTGFPSAGAGDLAYLGADPLPYGMEPNAPGLAMLIGMCADQGILAAAPDPSEWFLPVAG